MRLVERDFSDKENCPSILLANLNLVSDVSTNLSRMEKVYHIRLECPNQKRSD
jgi:hypothetical protein